MKEYTCLFDECFFFLKQEHNLFSSQFVVLLRVPCPRIPRQHKSLFRLKIICSLGYSDARPLLETYITSCYNPFNIFITCKRSQRIVIAQRKMRTFSSKMNTRVLLSKVMRSEDTSRVVAPPSQPFCAGSFSRVPCRP